MRIKPPVHRLGTTLRDRKTVITRANFWKIPHDSGRDDIRLKIGRYKKTGGFRPDPPETDSPKSELTLDDEEFRGLVTFIQDNYEPFRAGARAFIPLDEPFTAENADQVKALFQHPDQASLIKFIIDKRVIPGELLLGLRHVQRSRNVKRLREMLANDLVEQNWQKWFQSNDWVLGSDFVRVLDDRQIDVANVSDFLMEAYDGFLDVIEIKRPEGGLRFWAAVRDHGNYVSSSDLTKAVAQASRYLFELEREANSVKFLERVGHVKTVKPNPRDQLT